MRKIFPLICCFFFITACTFDNTATRKIVDEIGDLVDQYNSVSQLKTPVPSKDIIEQAQDELELASYGKKNNSKILESAVNEIKTSKQSIEEKQKDFMKINKQVKQLKSQLSDLSEERQKMATQVIDDFISLTDNEINIISQTIDQQQESIDFYQALIDGKNPPKGGNYQQSQQSLERLGLMKGRKLSQFNHSWNLFHKDVTGKEIRKTFNFNF